MVPLDPNKQIKQKIKNNNKNKKPKKKKNLVPVVAAEEAEHLLVPVVEQQPRRRRGPVPGSQSSLVGKKTSQNIQKKNIKKTNQNK